MNQFEPMLLIKMSRGIQAFESPEVNALEPLRSAMLHRAGQELAANPRAPGLVRGDEPPQKRAFFFGMRAIDRDGTMDFIVIIDGQPYSVAPFLESLEEFRHSACNLRLKRKTKADEATVEPGVKFGDTTDASNGITLVDGEVH